MDHHIIIQCLKIVNSPRDLTTAEVVELFIKPLLEINLALYSQIENLVRPNKERLP
jgi:hypothetical protein